MSAVVPPFSRVNVWVNVEDPRLARAEFGVVLESEGAAVVAERAVWGPGPSTASWREAHGSAGATSLARRWVIADGEVGGERSASTYLLLLNPTDVAVTTVVEVMCTRELGDPFRRDPPNGPWGGENL